MLDKNALAQLRQLKKDIHDNRNLVTGKIRSTHNKFGFLVAEGQKDIFLPADEMLKVLPDDEVEVEILEESPNKKIVKIEKILKKGRTIFVGKYVERGKGHFVESDMAGVHRLIFLPPKFRNGAKPGDYIQVELTKHPLKDGKAQGKVLKRIGHEKDSGIESDVAVVKFDLRESFPKPIIEASEKVNESALQALAETRKDYCDHAFVTIDAASTQDLDDALFAKTLEDGWELKIAIADPTALLGRDTKLINALVNRPSSTYLLGKYIPMLPSHVSSDICSLKPNETRLAIVVTAILNKTGHVKEYRIERSKIQSKARLTYQGVSDMLEWPEHMEDKYAESLTALGQIAQALQSYRQSNTIPAKKWPEWNIELNEAKEIQAIHRKTVTPAHRIVEECMVLCNSLVAKTLSDKLGSALYISQPGVRTDRIDNIKKVLSGHQQLNVFDPTKLEDFIQIIRHSQAEENLGYVDTLISKQMEKSSLSLEENPHFGLGVKRYTLFTSPLRRASDYIVHCLLFDESVTSEKLMGEKNLDRLEDQLGRIRLASQETENLLRAKCAQKLLKDDIWVARVTRITQSLIQVRVEENGMEGNIATKDLDQKTSFDPDFNRLTNGDNTIQLNQVLKVVFKSADTVRRQINFKLKGLVDT